MPYLEERRKQGLPDTFFHGLSSDPVAGDMNYLFTRIAHEYIERNGLRYQYCNDVVGALDGAKAEFQRRVVGPYEDLAIAKNGDVMSSFILSALGVGVKFSEEILALFDDDGGFRLVERYQVAILGSKKLNGVLCQISYGGIVVRRLEALLMAESDSIIIILDGRNSITLDVAQFGNLIPFLASCVS